MRVLVGIATYKRPEKLVRLLNSLTKQTFTDFDVHIVFDNKDEESMGRIVNEWINSVSHLFNVDTSVMQKQLFVIGCWNYLYRKYMYTNEPTDAFLMLCDDVELYPNCIEEAMFVFEHCLSGGLDGVVGLTQECPGRADYTYKPYGQTLIGRKFVERYKYADYKVCCPHYTHFYQDAEMWEWATKLGLRFHSANAKLKHYHPSFLPNEIDETHKIVRVPELFDNDKKLFDKRQTAGLLWGESFRYL